MDPLSEVLSLLRPRGYLSGGVDHGGAWAVSFPAYTGIKCYAVVAGGCWLAVDGESAIRVESGDCFLLPHGRSFLMGSSLDVPAVPSKVIAEEPLEGNIRTVDGGGSCLTIGTYFTFDESHAGLLLSALPPVVLLNSPESRKAVRETIDHIMIELRHPQPGSDLMKQQLAVALLIQGLRLHVKESNFIGPSWLSGLAEPRIAMSLRAIHDRPAYRWTLDTLAERAGLARSTFALRFREAVGRSPMDYLTHWRMILAADKLQNSALSVAIISADVGYESESAFSTAFKRVMGRSPREHANRLA